jgi:sulfite oxidase
MRTLLKEVQGIDWMDCAVMNCKWKGPRLRDVLLRAGVDEKRKDDLHVAFSCYQVECQEDRWYGGSVGLGRCLSEDAEVILALEVSQSLPVVICVRQYQIQGPILQESLSSVSN